MRETEADRAALNHLKVTEPDFIRQSAEDMTDVEQGAWFTQAGREFYEAGAKHVRYSVHPRKKNLRLVEGWIAVPANEGDPRWQEADG